MMRRSVRRSVRLAGQVARNNTDPPIAKIAVAKERTTEATSNTKRMKTTPSINNAISTGQKHGDEETSVKEQRGERGPDGNGGVESEAAILMARLEDGLTKAANPNKAPAMKAYMRNQFEFLGIQTPERREVTKQCFSQVTHPLTQTFVESVTNMCYARAYRDYHLVAVDLCQDFMKSAVKGKSEVNDTFFDHIRELIIQHSWWDTVDMLATNVLGPFLTLHTSYLGHMDTWIDDDNMWIRRSAILYQLKYKTDTDRQRLFSYCQKRVHEKEFFIEKAIGWALREYGKTDPAAVRGFVTQNKDILSTLSRKEALKHLGA